MRLSAKSEYGLRALIDIASCYGDGPVGSRDIAGRQQIPLKFLEQLVSSLRKAGILDSRRGAKGGFFLARPPGEVSVFEAVEALEGSLSPTKCVGDDAPTCARTAQCAAQDVWNRAKVALREALEEITLADLVERQERYDSRERPEEHETSRVHESLRSGQGGRRLRGGP
ncbi:MAG: Rrf2 family transcriptional regulator [Actinobacteria bacterium]|nr:MAG: Rrf2 family transcriptional regulator [Actinomycetota bacterium]